MLYLKWIGIVPLLCFTLAAVAQTADTSVTLSDALLLAEKNYPSLKARQFETEAAKKNIALARNTRIPSLDASYQVNLATYNNITGMLNPVGIESMTGPSTAGNTFSPVFGSAAGLLMNWQAVTFGQRTAEVGYSKAGVDQKEAEQQQALFQHQINVISTYLDVALAKELMVVYEANIERIQISLRHSRTLLSSGLKPGVDTALFQAELSKGKIDWLTAGNSFEARKINLSQFLATGNEVDVKDSLFFSRLPQKVFLPDSAAGQHPYIKYAQALASSSIAREKLLKHAYLPKLNVWSAAYARGSGIKYDGTVKATDGLGFSRYNYGVGLQLVLPLLKYSDTRLQTQQQNLVTQSIRENQAETLLVLRKQRQLSQATYKNALLIAKETATQLQSAQSAYNAMQIRYNTGLVNFTELKDARYNLLKAETEVRQSYWSAWKALLGMAAAQGDINLFLNEMK